MRKLYISNFNGDSGISKYSNDFYDCVLSSLGFSKIDTNYLDDIGSINFCYNDIIHIEIGLNQLKEIDIFYFLIKKEHKNIYITLHDPPLISYPYFKFKNKILELSSKFIHVYFNNFGLSDSIYGKVKRIFVLNRKAQQYLISKKKINSVYLPHIIRSEEISLQNVINRNFIYFGFIGKNKGLDYALKLHYEILKYFPDSIFYIIGKPAHPKNSKYLEKLKIQYSRNVNYLGFISNEKIKDVFSYASNVMLPFNDYKFYFPTNGTILTAMKYGKVVFTTPVNSIGELIQDNVNGFFLTRDIQSDIKKVKTVFQLIPEEYKSIQLNSVNFVQKEFSFMRIKELLTYD